MFIGRKNNRKCYLDVKKRQRSTAASVESCFAPPLREVFLNFFSASIASSSSSNNVTTDGLSNQSNTVLHLLVNDAISDAMDSAVGFAWTFSSLIHETRHLQTPTKSWRYMTESLVSCHPLAIYLRKSSPTPPRRPPLPPTTHLNAI